MSSEVEIVNMGLDMVGAESIASLTEGSNNANVANRIYPVLRDYLQRRYTWKFLTKRVKLARSANTPVYEFDYQYPLPADYIRIIDVHDNEDGSHPVPYKLEYDATDTRVIACSSENVWLTYVGNVTDTSAFSPDFNMALATRMAMVFAIKLAESRSLYIEMRYDYKEIIAGARSTSSMEDVSDPFPDGSWVTNRGVDTSQSWA